MIYNLAALLRAQFPAERFYVHGRVAVPPETTVPERCHVLNDSGGSEQPTLPPRYQVLTVQLISRDRDGPRAKKMAEDVFAFLQGRFGLVLPTATVAGVVYPAVTTAQISALQVPTSLGPDEDGRHEYSTNYQVIKERQ